MKPSENVVGKVENAGDQHFLIFQQNVLLFPKQISFFSVTFILLSVNAFNMDQSKNLSFGKDLTLSLPFATVNVAERVMQDQLVHNYVQNDLTLHCLLLYH